MKIIDFEKKGNVVRFYLGRDDCMDYTGDDFDDAPYEHNAGKVYDEYIENHVDIAFPLDWLVLEPQDDWHWQGNSPYSKDDMKNGIVPCIIAVPPQETEKTYEDGWQFWCASANVLRFYFEDTFENLPADHFVLMTDAGKLRHSNTYTLALNS